jgi:hypothetical protein
MAPGIIIGVSVIFTAFALMIIVGLFILLLSKRILATVKYYALYDTIIAVQNEESTMAVSVTVPFGSPGKVLAWDNTRRVYRWVAGPVDR